VLRTQLSPSSFSVGREKRISLVGGNKSVGNCVD
jgi:hypothetical protein